MASLYRKYRPNKFSDLVGEDHIRDTLLSAIKENKVGHAYLFSGPRGVGKTSVARLLSKGLNCQNRDEKSGEPCDECQSCLDIISGKSFDIIEIDAASNRGIEEIRELREKVKYAPSKGKFKVFIIDEVHMLTLPAFNALLKTLEEPPAHVVFIMATTEPHKVPATILSRVQHFDFRRIGKEDIIKNLKKIIKAEGFSADDASLEQIAVAADGSHRDAISILEQVASYSTDIKIDDVRSLLGLVKDEEIINLIEQIFLSESKKANTVLDNLIQNGVDPIQILKGVVDTLRDSLLIKINGDGKNLALTDDRITRLREISTEINSQKINRILQIFIDAGQFMKETAIKSLPIEMAIVSASAVDLPSEAPVEENAKSENLKPAEKKIEVVKSQETASDLPKPEVADKMHERGPEKQPSVEGTSGKTDSISSQTWKEILEKVKPYNHSLSALLRDAAPDRVENNVIYLNIKFKFHLDKICEAKNRQIIEEVISAIMGEKMTISCQIADPKAKIKAQKTEPIDLEKAAEEVFGEQ